MQQQLDMLQRQLETVEQFEKLFNSTGPQAFTTNLGNKQTPGTFLHFMEDNSAAAEVVFGTSDLHKNSDQIRLLELIHGVNYSDKAGIKSINPGVRSFHFLNLTIQAIQAYDGTKNKSKQHVNEKDDRIIELKMNTSALVEARKQAITEKIEQVSTVIAQEVEEAQVQKATEDAIAYETTAKASAAKNLSRQKFVRYTSAAVLETAGILTIGFSAAMQFSPKVALLVGLNLPPVAIAAIAVAGFALVAAGSYVAYRTYKPAPAVVVDTVNADATMNPTPVVGHSKAVTTAFVASGLGLAGFSALLQFSPKVALLMGLNLSPVALLSIAAVGALLLSVGLYRACKAYAAATPVVVNTDANVSTPTCRERLSKYACCLKIFGGKPTKTNTATTDQVNDMTKEPEEGHKVTL